MSNQIKIKLVLYWLCVVFTVLTVLILILNLTGIFSYSASKLYKSLKLQQQTAAHMIEGHFDALDASCISLSEQLTDTLNSTLTAEGLSVEALNDNSALIAAMESAGYQLLNTVLQSSACSGAFFVLDATCNTDSDYQHTSRMGIYLRYSDLSSVNSANKHIVYFRGMPEIARQENIQMHNRWNLEFDTALIPGYDALLEASVGRLAEYCLWTERVQLTDTWEDVMLLCVPILAADGRVVGVCGVELSELYFQLAYPASTSPYGDMVAGVTPLEADSLLLSGAMVGSSADTLILAAGELIEEEGTYYDRYSDNAREYIGMKTLLPVRTTTGREMAAVTLIPGKNFRVAEQKERVGWFAVFLFFLVSMMILSRSMSKYIVTPLEKLLREMTARHGGSDLPPNVEELFKTFSERVTKLTPMERTVLQYYIDGYSLDEVAAKAYISINTAKKHNTNINRKLGITSRDELLLYIDLFRRCGRINEITYHH